METIGLIGVGTMGRLMTECMKKAGYTVVAMDTSEASKKFCADNIHVPNKIYFIHDPEGHYMEILNKRRFEIN